MTSASNRALTAEPDGEALGRAATTPDRTRRIVDAACGLIDEGGLEGLTIRAVLKRTGLSRRALYERFEGKDDLVLAVLTQVIQVGVDELAILSAKLDHPMDRLKLVVSSIVIGRGVVEGADTEAGNRRGAALSREHLRLAESRPDALQAAIRPLVQLLARLLDEGMKAGLVREHDPERLAALVYNLVSTTVHMELRTQEAARPDRERRLQLADEIWEFCRRAIAA